jgi:pimeloyl-ACP methyl ester carboxylesterase
VKQIQFKNTSISYSDTGKVPLLFCFMVSRKPKYGITTFRLFQKKNRVITIDLLGHGETECLGYVHTMEDNADAVHSVLSELAYVNQLVGHSMGGYVALAFAELYPEYVKGLLNSTARADSEERKQNRDRAIKAVKHSFINFISLSIANLFSEGNRERLVDEIEM